MNRILKTAMACLSAALLLAGCGAPTPPPDYPEMESPDLEAVELAAAANARIELQYPADSWIAQPDTEPLMFLYADTYDAEQQVNINANVSSECNGDLDEEIMELLMGELEAAYGSSGMQFGDAELRMLGGAPVIYVECVLSISDELIDFMVEEGAWTEEAIEAVGGREAILATPDTNEVVLFAVVDGHIVIYTGAYYSADQKQTVLDTMMIMVQTSSLLI